MAPEFQARDSTRNVMSTEDTPSLGSESVDAFLQSTEASEEAWIPFVEPVPDWEEAKDVWGIWWYIHIYGIGGLFFINSLYTFTSLVLLFKMRQLSQMAYFVALHLLVLTFSTERGVFMFLDAYNAKGSLHPALAYLFLSFGLPCMASAFYLVFQAYSKATRMRLAGSVHKACTIVVIIVAHFAISVGLDLAAGFSLHAMELLVTCQAVFIAWAYTLSCMYFYLFRRLYRATVSARRRILRMSKYGGRDEQEKASRRKRARAGEKPEVCSSIPAAKLIFGAKLILASAILLFIIATLCLGGLIGYYLLNVTVGGSPEPWSWWSYELAVRLAELGLCWTLSLAATQPIARRLQKQWARRAFFNTQTETSAPNAK